MITIFSNKIKKAIRRSMMLAMPAMVLGAGFFASCVDNDFADDANGNYYSSTKMSAMALLKSRPETFSSFITLLDRVNYSSLLETRGTYTVFAPNNQAFDNYLKEHNYPSLEAIPQEIADTLVRNHIVKKGAYFTTDVSNATLSQMNMDDRFLVITSKADEKNDNALNIYVNKLSRLVEKDDSLTNGVLHVVDRLITPSSELLPDLMEQDSTITIFCQLLRITGLYHELHNYIDESYGFTQQGLLDSVYNGIPDIRYGGKDMTIKYPEKRYFKYTAFVEPDTIYQDLVGRVTGKSRKDVTINDVIRYIHDYQTLPEYKTTSPDDNTKYKEKDNFLYRFVAYHLMDRIGDYNAWAPSGIFLTSCCILNKWDPEDFWETMCPYAMIRFSRLSGGKLYANRATKGSKFSKSPGVEVCEPSQDDKAEQNATNGTYHYLKGILAYNNEVRDNVLKCRFRIDATTLSADFMNQGCRGNWDAGHTNENDLFGVKRGYIKNWIISEETTLALHPDNEWWSSYLGNAMCIKGQYDVQFKLPPVPEGTYEIRMGYVAGEERGVVQVYLNNEPCGIPVDLTYGTWNLASIVGDITDTGDEETDLALDKTLHNLGFMRGMDSYGKGNGMNFRADAPEHLRRILTTQYLKSGQDNWIRFRQVSKGNREWSFDYIELCPKDIYAHPDGEDRH